MTSVTPPYYFQEFLLPGSRRGPTPRERELGFTVKDLEWLYTVYRATDAARSDSTIRGYPMCVERLLVNLSGQPALPLAGTFMMSATPDKAKAVLYTPYGGLELFDSRATLLAEVSSRLTQPSQRTELLQFVSIDERDALPPNALLSVTTSVIQGQVIEDQENAILAAQRKNVATMLGELRKLPSLNTMLDTLLGILSRSYFPGLNQGETRVNTFRRASSGEKDHWIASETLRDVLLRFYIEQDWPADQTRTYTNAAHDTRGFNREQLAEDQQRWDSVVEQTSGTLSKLLNSLLKTYWNEDVTAGRSRLQFFAQALRDKFRADLLFKHQDSILSADETRALRGKILADKAEGDIDNHHFKVEKVRVDAPFQHHVDLASTLMISNSHAYLYTQSRGLQVLTNLEDLKDALLTMLKSAGYEDELFNFLSLDERSVFVSMDQIQVTGTPVDGDVVKAMLEDIMAKQSANLDYALGLYRRSEGSIDLGALLDSALDVRAMLDSRLLEQNTDGRWTVRPITSGDGQPTTVQAEKAKLQLKRLQSIVEAMKPVGSPPTITLDNLSTLPTLLLDKNQAHLSQAMLQGLIGEAQLRRLYKSFPADALALLDSALHADGMTRLKRHSLNGFIPDAFGLSVIVGADTTPHALANCFVLTERGGTDVTHSGTAVLWTPSQGYEPFASIMALREALAKRLLDPEARWSLTENLRASKRTPHQSFQLGPLRRIDDHLLDDRQQTYSDFVRDEIEHVQAMKLSKTRLQEWMGRLIQRPPPTNLPRAIAIARTITHQQALPAWLGMARPQEQVLHAELLEQYRISAPDERDYLHGITPMREQVVNALSPLLTARFPGDVIDPNDVLIPGRINLKGNTLSLPDFAMRHLAQLRAEDIHPKSQTTTPLPATLDGTAVVQLLRQLDLNGIYEKLVNTHLKGKGEDTRERRRFFCRQLPWQILQFAHQQKLDDRLSDSAWSLVKQVFDMPDATARKIVDGATATIRPLELIATKGATLAKALGCYLIGPKDDTAGPLVLYAPYSPQHLLTEYANEQALINEFITPGALQAWVTCQLEAPHQATYRNLLSQQKTRDNPEISLGAHPIAGNLFKQLFEDNSEMLLRMLACQFSEGGKERWNAVTNVFSQGILKGLQFIAGKLAYPLVVWRSYQLFKNSAEDLQQHRWQHALKSFIGGVAQLAYLRNELDTVLPSEPVPEPEADVDVTQEEPQQAPGPTTPTLADLDLTGPERTQLQVFESHDTALADLTKSTSTQLYRDKTGTRHFVPLAGKVYPVRENGGRWHLSQDKSDGPFLQHNAQGQWELDLRGRYVNFGLASSKAAKSRQIRRDIKSFINVEAVGLENMRALCSWKASCVVEAINVATYYTVNCKLNLRHYAAVPGPKSRLAHFVKDFFDVAAPTSDQMQRIEKRVDEVLDGLTDPTLTGPNSMRIVAGTQRARPHDTFAFAIPGDTGKKIYLMDRFFDPQIDVYENRLSQPFNLSQHARGTTLIHEISHINSSTVDLAYLESMRPFHDLLNVKVKGTTKMKKTLADVRRTALSTLTPAGQLFRTLNDATNKWEDFGTDESTKELEAKVLSTTGALTLAQARHTFMTDIDKRIDTILANADSVTYLISVLGRELDPGA